jgi:hypothetical protein
MKWVAAIASGLLATTLRDVGVSGLARLTWPQFCQPYKTGIPTLCRIHLSEILRLQPVSPDSRFCYVTIQNQEVVIDQADVRTVA